MGYVGVNCISLSNLSVYVKMVIRKIAGRRMKLK